MQKSDFKSKTETVDGIEYTLLEMDAGTALAIQEQFIECPASTKNAIAWSDQILAASLRIAVEDLHKFPMTHYRKVKDTLGPIALEMNGFKTKAADVSEEAQAGAMSV